MGIQGLLLLLAAAGSKGMVEQSYETQTKSTTPQSSMADLPVPVPQCFCLPAPGQGGGLVPLNVAPTPPSTPGKCVFCVPIQTDSILNQNPSLEPNIPLNPLPRSNFPGLSPYQRPFVAGLPPSIYQDGLGIPGLMNNFPGNNFYPGGKTVNPGVLPNVLGYPQSLIGPGVPGLGSGTLGLNKLNPPGFPGFPNNQLQNTPGILSNTPGRPSGDPLFGPQQFPFGPQNSPFGPLNTFNEQNSPVENLPFAPQNTPFGSKMSPGQQNLSPRGASNYLRRPVNSPFGPSDSPFGLGTSQFGPGILPNDPSNLPYGPSNSQFGPGNSPFESGNPPYDPNNLPYGPSNSQFGPGDSPFVPGNPPHDPNNLPYGPSKTKFGSGNSPFEEGNSLPFGPDNSPFGPGTAQFGPGNLQYGPSNLPYGPSNSQLRPGSLPSGPGIPPIRGGNSPFGPGKPPYGPSDSSNGPSSFQFGPGYLPNGPIYLPAGPNNSPFGPNNWPFGPSNLQAGPNTSKFGPNSWPFGPINSQFGLNNSPFGPNNSMFGTSNLPLGALKRPLGPQNSPFGQLNPQSGPTNTSPGSLSSPFQPLPSISDPFNPFLQHLPLYQQNSLGPPSQPTSTPFGPPITPFGLSTPQPGGLFGPFSPSIIGPAGLNRNCPPSLQHLCSQLKLNFLAPLCAPGTSSSPHQPCISRSLNGICPPMTVCVPSLPGVIDMGQAGGGQNGYNLGQSGTGLRGMGQFRPQVNSADSVAQLAAQVSKQLSIGISAPDPSSGSVSSQVQQTGGQPQPSGVFLSPTMDDQLSGILRLRQMSPSSTTKVSNLMRALTD